MKYARDPRIHLGEKLEDLSVKNIENHIDEYIDQKIDSQLRRQAVVKFSKLKKFLGKRKMSEDRLAKIQDILGKYDVSGMTEESLKKAKELEGTEGLTSWQKKLVERIGKVSIKDLSLKEVTEVNTALEEIIGEQDLSDERFQAKNAKEMADMVKEGLAGLEHRKDLEQIKGSKRSAAQEKQAANNRRMTRKILSVIGGTKALNILTIVEKIEGKRYDKGAFGKVFAAGSIEAHNKDAETVQKLRDEIKDSKEYKKYDKEVTDKVNKDGIEMSLGGDKVDLSISDVLDIYLHMNASSGNKEIILKEGYRPLAKPEEFLSYEKNGELVKATSELEALATNAPQYIKDMGDKIFEVTKEIGDIASEASEIVDGVPWQKRTEKYWTRRRRQSQTAKVAKAVSGVGGYQTFMSEFSGEPDVESQSFFKERKEGLVTDGMIGVDPLAWLPTLAEGTSKYRHYGKLARVQRAFLEQMTPTMKKKGMQKYISYLSRYTIDILGGKQVEESYLAKQQKKILSGVAVVKLADFLVWAIQPMSLTNVRGLNLGAVAKMMVSMVPNTAQKVNDLRILRLNSSMRARLGKAHSAKIQATHGLDSHRDNYYSDKKSLSDIISSPINYMDEVAMVGLLQVARKEMKNSELTGEAKEQALADRAWQLAAETQVQHITELRSEVGRGKDITSTFLKVFTSATNQMYNVLYRNILAAQRGELSYTNAVAENVKIIVAIGAFNSIKVAIRAHGKDREENMFRAMYKGLLNTILGMYYIPFGIDQVISQALTNPKNLSRSLGEDTLLKSAANVYRAGATGDIQTTTEAVSSLVEDMSTLTPYPIPVNKAYRTSKHAYKLFDKAINGTSPIRRAIKEAGKLPRDYIRSYVAYRGKKVEIKWMSNAKLKSESMAEADKLLKQLLWATTFETIPLESIGEDFSKKYQSEESKSFRKNIKKNLDIKSGVEKDNPFNYIMNDWKTNFEKAEQELENKYLKAIFNEAQRRVIRRNHKTWEIIPELKKEFEREKNSYIESINRVKAEGKYE